MKKIAALGFGMLVALVVASCRLADEDLMPGTPIGKATSPLASPTEPFLPTVTTQPDPTPTPAAIPLALPTPSITPLSLPNEPPLTAWNNILIIPGAIAGREDAQGYLYSINMAVRKVQKYYIETLKAQNWEVKARGTKEGALLIAHRLGKILSIAISLHKSGLTLVRISLDESD